MGCFTWKTKHEAKIMCAGIIKLPLKTCSLLKYKRAGVLKLHTEKVEMLQQKFVKTAYKLMIYVLMAFMLRLTKRVEWKLEGDLFT